MTKSRVARRRRVKYAARVAVDRHFWEKAKSDALSVLDPGWVPPRRPHGHPDNRLVTRVVPGRGGADAP